MPCNMLGQLDMQLHEWASMWNAAHPGPKKDEADRIYGSLAAIREQHLELCTACAKEKK